MSSGAIANARELEAIGHEITNLRRRIGDREDELLAIMERREAIEAGAREAEALARDRRAAAEQVAAASSEELAAVETELAARRGRAPAACGDDRSGHARAVRGTAPPEEGRRRGGARRQRVPGVPRAAVLGRARSRPARRRHRALRPLPTDPRVVSAPRRVIINCDGAARGNPGPAGAGAVVVDEDGVGARGGRRGARRDDEQRRGVHGRRPGPRGGATVGRPRGAPPLRQPTADQSAHRPLQGEGAASAAAPQTGAGAAAHLRARRPRARPARTQRGRGRVWPTSAWIDGWPTAARSGYGCLGGAGRAAAGDQR